MKLRRLWVATCTAALGVGCATVHEVRTEPNYDATDKSRVKRLLVVTAPLPEENPKEGQLWSTIARRYVNQRRDFLVKADKATTLPGPPASFEPRTLCGEGLEGVLWLWPTVKKSGEGLEQTVQGKLVRCSDGGEIWSAKASGTWNSTDNNLKEYVAQYVSQMGPEVQPYVAPTFHLLKATLDTLPNPVLNDEDQNEKIELGD